MHPHPCHRLATWTYKKGYTHQKEGHTTKREGAHFIRKFVLYFRNSYLNYKNHNKNPLTIFYITSKSQPHKMSIIKKCSSGYSAVFRTILPLSYQFWLKLYYCLLIISILSRQQPSPSYPPTSAPSIAGSHSLSRGNTVILNVNGTTWAWASDGFMTGNI